MTDDETSTPNGSVTAAVVLGEQGPIPAAAVYGAGGLIGIGYALGVAEALAETAAAAPYRARRCCASHRRRARGLVRCSGPARTPHDRRGPLHRRRRPLDDLDRPRPSPPSSAGVGAPGWHPDHLFDPERARRVHELAYEQGVGLRAVWTAGAITIDR